MVRVKEGVDFESPGVVDARWWRPLADGSQFPNDEWTVANMKVLD